MLVGRYTNVMDPKGRVIIPSSFRDYLEPKFYFTKGLDKSLYFFSEKQFVSFVERLTAELPNSNEDYSEAYNHFVHYAVESEMDKQGRIIIPPELRVYAQLEKDILFIGDTRKILAYNPTLYKDSDGDKVRRTMSEMRIVI